MEKQDLDLKITEAARVIRSYCIARTSSQMEAEDLAQDIILEIYKSAANIRSSEAFYGFMWAVAGNVYRQWCKTKAKRQFDELLDEMPCKPFDKEKDGAELHLLRRELALLAEKYRKAVILYYIDQKSCPQIASILSVSESMVKYLLFKSRHILKEGMSMERIYGEQSYNPKSMVLQFWGHGPNNCYHLCDSRVAQNILFACYYEKLTAEQIALEIGISLPYMEDQLHVLYEGGLLNKEGNRYCANIAIFTSEFQKEVKVKTAQLKKEIANLVMSAVRNHEQTIRSIPFAGRDMGENTYVWQMACRILYSAIIEDLNNRVQLNYPNERYGENCFIWGIETDEQDFEFKQFGFGVSNSQNKEGDYIQYLDFPINGEMVHHYFYCRQSTINVFLDLAKENTAHFSENDWEEAAELVKKGYVLSAENGLKVNVPVLTELQHQQIKNCFSEAAAQIADQAEKMMQAVAAILKDHLPSHLKKLAADLAYLRLFDDAISAPMAYLFERKELLAYCGEGMLPTTYIILK